MGDSLTKKPRVKFLVRQFLEISTLGFVIFSLLLCIRGPCGRGGPSLAKTPKVLNSRETVTLRKIQTLYKKKRKYFVVINFEIRL
jgi:hypothetical protein